ncbi:MAG: nucleotidyltransferase family protein [Anaerolineales bacterium]|jgi:predicted nucleotidyltransferase
MFATNRDQVIDLIQSNHAAFRHFGVKSLALFGSAARNRLRRNSDVDILVQFEYSTWTNYIGLKIYLEDLLGRKVDLVTPKAIRPATRPSIEKDLMYVVS